MMVRPLHSERKAGARKKPLCSLLSTFLNMGGGFGAGGQSGGPTYAEEVLTDSPVAYYRLGESSGSTASDETGSYDGVYYNSPTLGVTGALSGDTDTAVRFDDASSQRMTAAGTSSVLSGATEFSVEFWLNRDTVNNKVIPFSTFSSSLEGIVVQARDTGELQCFYYYDSSNADAVFSGTTYGSGTWNHVVVTKDASNLKIYVDGVEKGAVSSSGSVSGGQDWTLGARDNGGFERFLDGILDEVAIYDYALSLSQIQAHYNSA